MFDRSFVHDTLFVQAAGNVKDVSPTLICDAEPLSCAHGCANWTDIAEGGNTFLTQAAVRNLFGGTTPDRCASKLNSPLIQRALRYSVLLL